MTIETQLPAGLKTPVAERLQAAAGEQVVRRLWERDGTLWAPEGTPELTDRLGWLDIAERLAAEADDLQGFGAEVHDAGITDAVLLGMGGSSPGPAVLRRAAGDRTLRRSASGPRLEPPMPSSTASVMPASCTSAQKPCRSS